MRDEFVLRGDLAPRSPDLRPQPTDRFEQSITRFFTDKEGTYTILYIGEEAAQKYGAASGEHRNYLPKGSIVEPGIRYDIVYEQDAKLVGEETDPIVNKGFFLTGIIEDKKEENATIYRYSFENDSGKSLTYFTNDGQNFGLRGHIMAYEKTTFTPQEAKK